MIKHHEGAVEMARMGRADGACLEAKKMADAVVTSPSTEISRMNSLLGKS